MTNYDVVIDPQVPFDDLHIETKYYEPPEDFDNHE